MACFVEDVTAPDGTRSRLFDQLLQVTTNDQEALRLYLNIMGEPLPDELYNEHGEPHLGDVIERDDLGFNESHRALYSVRDYSVAGKTSTTYSGIKEILENARNSIRNRISNNISPEEKSSLNEILGQLDSQIKNFGGPTDVEIVREVATEHIDWVKSLLENPESLTPGQTIMALNLMDSWSYDITSKMLDDSQRTEDNEINQTFLEIDRQVQQTRNDILREAKQILLEEMNNMNFPEAEGEATLSDLEEFPEDRTTWLLVDPDSYVDMSARDQRMLQMLDDTLKRAKRNRATWINEINNELIELGEKVDDTSVLLQKDENGNFTGGLINPYSIEFWEKRDNAFDHLDKSQSAGREEGIAAGKPERREFVRSLKEIGEVVDVRYFINELDNPPGFSSAQEYRAELENKLGKEEADRAIRSAKQEWNDYVRQRQGYKDQVASEIANGEHIAEDQTPQEYREERMQQYERRESPVVFLQEVHQGAEPTVFNDGWNHVYHAANAEFQDESWNRLSPQEEELADYLRQLYSSLFKILPNHVTRDLNANFLPRVEKDVIEKFQEDGIMEAAQFLGDDFFDEVTGEDIKTLRNEESLLPNPFGEKSVPLRFISEESVSLEDRSKNVMKITQMFAAMAINHRFMTEVEPLGHLVHRVAEENLGQGSNTLESIEYNLNAMLYDQRREKSEGVGFITSYNPKQIFKDRRKRKQLERESRELEEKRENGEIDRTEYIQEQNRIEGEYADLKGKGVDPWRIIESTVGRFTMLSSMGYNIQTGIANGLFGIMAASVHAAGEQDFTSKNFRDAFMTYFRLKTKGSGKVGNLMKNMDILHEISEIAYGQGDAARIEKQNMIKNVKLNPYYIMRETETMIQSMTMMSIMMGNKVEVEVDGETQEISLWQAFDENGEWDTSKYGERPEWTAPTGPTEQNQWTRLRERVVQLNKRLHGNYDVNSPMDIKKIPLGRLVMMFRSWIPEGIRYRFGSKRPDSQLGRYVKGSYRSLWDVASEHGFAVGPLELFKTAWKKDWEGEGSELSLDEIDVRNMRKVMKDMQWGLGMTAIMLALRGIIDDDEEDRFQDFAARSTINTIFRVRQDITFYLSPVTPLNIINNPMPATRTIMDGYYALDASRRFLMEEDYRGHPGYQWLDTFSPSNQVTDTLLLLKNLETEGEWSSRVQE